ncbi:hypothetical protein REPUB_Repub05bG0060100 [Reevesia pubescens]
MAEEHLYHVLFGCWMSRDVWLNFCPWILDLYQEGIDWETLFLQASWRNQLDLVMTIICWLWKNRNKCYYDFFSWSVRHLVCMIHNSVDGWSHMGHLEISSSVRKEEVTWSAPSSGFIKVNTDASFNMSFARLGVVA